jgi:hypothetical protein
MAARSTATSEVFNLSYDAENRLASVSGGALATFVYDGDGQRVKGTAAQNYASGITPTSDVTLNNPVAVTDGDYWANSSSEYASTASGLHYVQVDLGAVFTLDRVRVWHYAAPAKTEERWLAYTGAPTTTPRRR